MLGDSIQGIKLDRICPFNDNVFDKASVAYNNVFRHLLDIPRGVSMSQYYMYNGVDHFKVLYRKAIGVRCAKWMHDLFFSMEEKIA